MSSKLYTFSAVHFRSSPVSSADVYGHGGQSGGQICSDNYNRAGFNCRDAYTPSRLGMPRRRTETALAARAPPTASPFQPPQIAKALAPSILQVRADPVLAILQFRAVI